MFDVTSPTSDLTHTRLAHPTTQFSHFALHSHLTILCHILLYFPLCIHILHSIFQHNFSKNILAEPTSYTGSASAIMLVARALQPCKVGALPKPSAKPQDMEYNSTADCDPLHKHQTHASIITCSTPSAAQMHPSPSRNSPKALFEVLWFLRSAKTYRVQVPK